MVRPTEEIDACVAAHRRVLTTVERLRDDDVRAPSLLPGWSRAHVIAHLERNADSHVWLFEGARIGDIRHQYPRAGMRETDIEASSAQTADALVHDLRRSCDALERAWHDLDDDLWERECVVTTGSRAVSELVFRRLREVEVHHVDLGEAYSSADWPDTYVEGELRRRLAGLASRADHRALVEWLIGRQPAPELGRW